MQLQQTVDTWCEAHPAIASYFETLNDHNIRWALFAGASVSLLTGNRTPTDIDIIVHDDDFETVAQLTPGAEHKRPLVCDLPTGDGMAVRYRGDELVFELDGTEIEVMARATNTIEGHVFAISLTDVAVRHRISVTSSVTIYIADPFDTAAIKAIMQRGVEQHKFDFEDTKALVAIAEFSAEYVAERSREIGLDDRALDFLRRAGLKV